MKTEDHTMPTPVASLLSRLPRLPGSVLFASWLNILLARQLPEDVKRALTGRMVTLCVTDAGLAFDFTFSDGWFWPRTAMRAPDLRISAHALDFYRLARGRVDADTLFFGRRLLLEGDTELGVLVKYTLDALERPLFDQALRLPALLLSGIRSRWRTVS